MYLLYGVVQIVAFPLVLWYLVWRGLKDRRYFEHMGERFGWVPIERTAAGAIWLHAVSVGEVLSAIELLKELRGTASLRNRERPLSDDRDSAGASTLLALCTPLYVSTATLAGRAMAEEKLAGLADAVFYAPLDFGFCVRNVLRRVRPSLVVVMETEIWPNLYREPKKAGCSVAVVNGRISDRTLPTYRRFHWFFQAALAQPDRIWAQSPEDAERYLELGAPAERVVDGGNLKWNFDPAGKPVAADLLGFLDGIPKKAVWIAASTMPEPDEDDVVIEAFQKLGPTHPELLLILVPRKPERFDLAARKLASAGVRFVRRSQLGKLELPGVLLLDSMGELSALFGFADVVFMGGTLKWGGHNLLEPAHFGKPVIVGPCMQNFAAIHKVFVDANALVQIGGAEELAPAVARLLDDPGERAAIGERAKQAASAHRGVAKKLAAELISLHAAAVPPDMYGWGQRLMLGGLGWVWGAFSRTPDGARSLDKRVISIGGITMGGTGKTPMAIWLADRLRARGLTPGILTRGYRRQTPHTEVIVPAGHAAAVELTGDEAQIFVRRGTAHLGIDSDRYRVGRRMEALLRPDIFILDDGFQHRKLKRDVDLVLIDVLDPFGGGEVFPLGRLREPIENLARATAFVLTRAEPGKRTDGIEAVLRAHNPQAPIFRSWVVPSKWRGGTPAGRVAAFCGLGNPNTFWRVLGDQGLSVELKWIYGDHHQYTCLEARRMKQSTQAAGIEYLVTTEKDYVNLPDGVFAALSGVKLCWVEVEVRVEGEEGLLRTVM